MALQLKILPLAFGIAVLAASPVMAELHAPPHTQTTTTTFPSAPVSPHSAFVPDWRLHDADFDAGPRL
jgi:hypothetical protein